MAQVFKAQAEFGVKLVLLALVVGTLGTLAILLWRARVDDQLGAAQAQPVPFSHKHHVGDVGLDCRFCHVTVETRAFPGMPSAQLCLGCHAQLFADQPVFEPLRRAARGGEPLAWRKLNTVADYAYFDHSVHIAKNVACIECHGNLDQMPLAWQTHVLQMRWCIECHRDPAPHLHPKSELYSLRPTTLSQAERESLAHWLQLESSERRLDCSTCHR